MKLSEELEYIAKVCNTFDKPIPYKNWEISPVILTSYYDFMSCYGILCIDKNAIPNVDIISMSYLKFLIKIQSQIDATCLQKLSILMSLCLGIDESFKVLLDEKGRCYFEFNDKTIMTSKDFDIISHLILSQNILNYKDMSNMDSSMKKSIYEYNSIKNKDIQQPSLDKKIAIVQSQTGIPKYELCKMTMRSFDILFDTVVEKVDYEVNKPTEQNGIINGNLKVSRPIEHWVWKKERGAFADAFVSYDNIENEINKANNV